jgi:very-short-patch-repair endonuclease
VDFVQYTQTDLENAGFTVIRFTDEEILTHINSVNSALEDHVINIMKEKGITPRVRIRKRD